MKVQSPVEVGIRLICVSPPNQTYSEKHPVFGLQDKTQNIHSGMLLDDGSLQFDCVLNARQGSIAEKPDWGGSFVHGDREQRFLYLSWGYKEDTRWNWIKRIKVPLSIILWKQVEEANKENVVIQAYVDGKGAASVELLGDGWSIQQK